MAKYGVNNRSTPVEVTKDKDASINERLLNCPKIEDPIMPEVIQPTTLESHFARKIREANERMERIFNK